MKRRTEPLKLSTSGYLDEPHDYVNDPEVLRIYREALAAPDLKDGRLPDEITVDWREYNGVRAAFMAYAGAPEDKLLFHIHGGGWAGGVPCTGLQGMVSLQEELKVNMVSIEYGLVPEHPYPEGLNDCVNAFKGVLDAGYSAENIVLIGESAGGYYCLAVAIWLKEHGLPMPGGLCLVSPGVEMRNLDELKANIDAHPEDPMSWQMYAFNKWYVGDNDPNAPYMHLLDFDMTGLPPVLIQCGGLDFCSSDCVRLAHQLGISNVDVLYHSWEQLPHVFFLLPIPEAEYGRKELADFILARMDLR